MKVLIVEDERLLARQLEIMLLAVAPESKIVANTNSIESTVKWLGQTAAPDLILMDIELADGQCFEIFNQVPVHIPVIFTTAYDEYALRAFKVNAIDYLLKPIQEPELRAAINKLKLTNAQKENSVSPSRINALLDDLKHATSPASHRNRFLVKQGQKMLSVSVDDIAFFHARNTLNFLVTNAGQRFVIDYTLNELEGIIDPTRFFRVNRQYIIGHGIIEGIHPWFNGKVKVESSVELEEDIIISREKAPLFKAWLGE